MRSAATPVLGSPDKADHTIEYLSSPAPVRMAQQWFDVASLDHFWVRRRFTVFQRLAGSRISTARELAEVGCGHGLLQRQIEDAYGREVWGFDLNECALKQNVSQRSKLYCYDICQRDAALRGRYDLMFVFDVLEHISEESAFLQALLYHLSPVGSLVVNVPAGQWAYSSYDKAAGHVRRYSFHILEGIAAANGLALKEWSYWGLPLVPALFLRSFWLMGRYEECEIITAGFGSRSSAVNKMMTLLSSLERVPQKLLGTSLMAILERADQVAPSSSGKTTLV